MSEWWTYTLSDFLMFSPRTYWRLIELYNIEVWPAQIAAVAAGFAILLLRRAGGATAARTTVVLLALAWIWVAFAFLLTRYDAINWAGRYFALGFAIEALSITAWGIAAGKRAFGPIGGATARIGLGMFAFALLGYPLVAAIAGRPWTQAELFALAPDPTAIGTLGILLASRARGAGVLSLLPALWCLISAATLWAMGSVEALLPSGAAFLALLVVVRRRVREA